MYNKYYELLEKQNQMGALHANAVEVGNKELAKYYSDEYERLEKEIEDYEERNGLI